MIKQKQLIGISESFSFIEKNNNPSTPILEGLVNALDSIKQRQANKESFTPYITISLYYKFDIDLLKEEHNNIDSISIEDNGIGFTTDNLTRFKHLGDKTKNLNNRGTGKIQFFYRFKEIEINSSYVENNQYKTLKLQYELHDEINEEITTIQTDEFTGNKTIVRMNNFYGSPEECNYFEHFLTDLSLLKKSILKRILLRMYLEKSSGLTITIKTYIDNIENSELIISKDDIPKPDKKDTISIDTVKLAPAEKGKENLIKWEIVNSNEVLNITRFKLPANETDENGVYLCSKNILIKKFPFPIIRKSAEFNGFRYLTSVSGNILDKENNLKHSVDDFTFPHKSDIEKQIREGDYFCQNSEYIFYDEIKEKLNLKLSTLYSDIKNIQEEKQQDIYNLAKKFGISKDIAEEVKIEVDDSHDDITKKLFSAQAKHFAIKSIEIQKSYDELKQLETKHLDPTNKDEYATKFNELSTKLLTLIPEQNKDELTRYIIRRDIIVKLLALALKNELTKQKEWKSKKEAGEKVREEQEAIFHDLIFKRKAKGTPNDLWILNEEFVHFDGCSDLPLNEITIDGNKLLRDDIDINDACKKVGLTKEHLEKRPDIFLFPKDGKCILIEFKAPAVHLSLHLDQIARYAKLIANYSTKPLSQFYGFLIGENINKIDIPGRYKKAISSNYWFYPSEPIIHIEKDTPIADLYQEIIPLSTIATRAEIRNRSFAEKLGIENALDIKDTKQ